MKADALLKELQAAKKARETIKDLEAEIDRLKEELKNARAFTTRLNKKIAALEKTQAEGLVMDDWDETFLWENRAVLKFTRRLGQEPRLLVRLKGKGAELFHGTNLREALEKASGRERVRKEPQKGSTK